MHTNIGLCAFAKLALKRIMCGTKHGYDVIDIFRVRTDHRRNWPFNITFLGGKIIEMEIQLFSWPVFSGLSLEWGACNVLLFHYLGVKLEYNSNWGKLENYPNWAKLKYYSNWCNLIRSSILSVIWTGIHTTLWCGKYPVKLIQDNIQILYDWV